MRVVDPYKIRLVTTGTTIEDKEIVVPIGNAFDGIGQNQQVEDYVEKLADDSVNPIVDYEKMRYTPYSGTSVSSGVTETMGYDFYFYGEASKLDYKLSEEFDRTTYIDFTNTTFIEIGSYLTKSVFVYSNIHTELVFTFDQFYLTMLKAGAIDATAADNVLQSAIINIIGKIGITQVGISYLDVQITPTGSSYLSTQSIGIVNLDIWKRDFTVKVTYITGPPIGAGVDFNIEAKLTLPNITASVGDYTVNYKAVSSEAEGYNTDYTADKIQSFYIENSFKGYTNSYFRLDYFDSVIEEAQNLLFTDVLTVSEGVNPSDAIFSTKLNKQNYFLYWLKDDPIIEEQGYRDVYMTARFFNASTGQIQQFFHLSDEWSQPLLSSYLPNVDQYQTLMKYTKIRLFKNYRYIICKRTLTLPSSTLSGTTVGGFDITDSDTIGVNKISLNQIRLK